MTKGSIDAESDAAGRRVHGCSEAEWKVRVDLAAAYRLVAHYGWDDLISRICPRGCRGRSTTSSSTPTT